MTRMWLAILGITLSLATHAWADPPAGTWKLTLRTERQPIVVLFALSQSEGKWVADFVDATARFPKDPTFADVTVQDQAVSFRMLLDGQTLLSFDGLIAKEGKVLKGSINQGGGPLELTELQSSTLKKLADPYAIMLEQVNQSEDAQIVFEAAQIVLEQAAEKMLDPDEARRIVDKVTRLAAGYGTRWERDSSLRVARTLSKQKGFDDIALAQARRAERMLKEQDPVDVRLEVLETLESVLKLANKADEAKGYQTQVARLEARDYLEYAKTNPPFKPEPFAGRKANSDRVVLVELFTNVDLGPTAAFDLAGESLQQAYTPKDVIILSYHFNQPRAADPLANTEVQQRLGQYADYIERGGLSFVAGKPSVRARPNMTAEASKEVFEGISEQIKPLLETPNTVKLALALTPAEQGITAKVTYSELPEKTDKLALRLAIVEDRIRHAGENGIRYHRNVVRSMPGGAKGVPITMKAGEHSVTINMTELRTMIGQSLENFARETDQPIPDRLSALKNLRLVAFIQNDESGEILQATQAALEVK